MSKYKVPKRPPPDIGLFMECEEDELSSTQKTHYGKLKKDHQKFIKKMDEYVKKLKGEVIVEEGDCFMLQFNQGLQSATTLPVITNVQQGSIPVQQPPAPVISPKPASALAPRPTRAVAPQLTAAVKPVKTSTLKSRRARPAAIEKPANSAVGPGEASSLGGLAVNSRIVIPPPVLGACDSEEVAIPKIPGKTYPSLSVTVKPTLLQFPNLLHKVHSERVHLDAKVKGVLMYTPAKFSEWLIQQGLIRSEQKCHKHRTARKLGLFNDVTRFPHSGGYVWISDCCPNEFVSIYYGSIFENSVHTPNVLLKLIYHWSCQTNIPNVVQWVKIDSWSIKEFYYNLRAVCSLAVEEKFGILGGPEKVVEIGIITLTHPLELKRQFDVMGAMDMETKRVRLKVVEMAIYGRKVLPLTLLSRWVDKRSIIIADTKKNAQLIKSSGFKNVKHNIGGASEVIEYLRKSVTKLFQFSLHILSKQLIQQFLDELVWREFWGPIASHAFNNMVKHIADYTLHAPVGGLLPLLKKAALNPFQLPVVHGVNLPPESDIEETALETPKRVQKRPVDEEAEAAPPPKKITLSKQKATEQPTIYWEVQRPEGGVTADISNFLTTNCTVRTETFYYGYLPGDDSKIIDRKPAEMISVKCCICLKTFLESVMLLKHLLLHCQIKPPITGPLRKVHQCQLCFVGFESASAHRSHMAEVHHPSSAMRDVICFICEKRFSDQVQFLYHMTRNHVAMEMPYSCRVCGFRTSWYSSVIEHITQVHGSGMHLFCPHCLKTVGLCRNNQPLPGNVVFFVNHVQRHQRDGNLNCPRCRLTFVCRLDLQKHLEKDHSSFQGNSNIRPLPSVCSTMMPQPGSFIKPALLPLGRKFTRKMGQYSVREFPVPVRVIAPESACCAECEGSVKSPRHFSGEIRCSRCRFLSCCEVAVSEHFSIYHEKSASVPVTPGKPVSAAPTMYCPCGFFSSSANNLAKHMIDCGEVTAFPDETSARAARLSSSNDAEHTVLNVLGLIRNPQEPTPAGNSTADLSSSLSTIQVSKQEASENNDENNSESFSVTQSQADITGKEIEKVVEHMHDAQVCQDNEVSSEDIERTFNQEGGDVPSRDDTASIEKLNGNNFDKIGLSVEPSQVQVSENSSSQEIDESETSNAGETLTADEMEETMLVNEHQEAQETKSIINQQGTGEFHEKTREQDERENTYESVPQSELLPFDTPASSANVGDLIGEAGGKSEIMKESLDSEVENLAAEGAEEAAAGRLIEELENMMETDDITSSNDAPDFIADLI